MMPPRVLPAEAVRRRSQGLTPTATRATMTVSLLKGRMLPARKAERNMPQGP